jgi:hypothetical protein
MRGQTELPALAIAFLLLTGAVTLGITAATTAFDTADREALERHHAERISDDLVATSSPITARANVVNETALETLNDSRLGEQFAPSGDVAFRLQLDGETVARHGEVDDQATTIERIVLVENPTSNRLSPPLNGGRSVTLPRRTFGTTVRITPPNGTTVRRVWANDRVVLANASGLRGQFELSLSSMETTQLFFEAAGPLPAGSTEIRYEQSETRKATMAVTVDA